MRRNTSGIPKELKNLRSDVISQENIVSGSKVFSELVFQCFTCYEDPDGDIRNSPVCMSHCLKELIESQHKHQKLKVIFNTKHSQITYSLQESKKLGHLAHILKRIHQKFDKIVDDYVIEAVFFNKFNIGAIFFILILVLYSFSYN